jgi:lipopolysaccharide heptosyltransferase II
MRHIKYIYKKKWMLFNIFLIDLIGYSLLNIIRFFQKPQNIPESIKKILVFKLDHIGDVLMTTPALKVLKSRYPDASLTIVVGSWSKDILKDNPDVDEILTYDAYWFNRNIDRRFNIKKTWKFIKELRKRRFDIFYSLRGDFIGILISSLLKIPVRIGFNNGGGGFLLTHPLTPIENIHQVEQFLYAIEGNDPKSRHSLNNKNMEIVISDAERRFTDNLIRKHNGKNGKFIGFHIGAGYPSKLWTPEKYGILIKRLYDEFGIHSILVGGEEDRAMAKRIENIIRDTDSANCIGRANIKETAALIERCTLFIGNDSAPVHIAAAIGIPVIVIFSAANNPVGWKPFGSDVACITKDIQCKYCEKFECIDARCMRMITVDEVYNKAKEILYSKIKSQN